MGMGPSKSSTKVDGRTRVPVLPQPMAVRGGEYYNKYGRGSFFFKLERSTPLVIRLPGPGCFFALFAPTPHSAFAGGQARSLIPAVDSSANKDAEAHNVMLRFHHSCHHFPAALVANRCVFLLAWPGAVPSA
ncbi:predicted protein [Coccidioides posadasii str. Silveira]|uniref:Predicted protein n=1 Tax=Coccidioides posadasii (strain RMSCC 757 / Silveira) TaxID=443226 RepID=E9D1D6_COCPS|nr:predicted protein [Coccidioides posadasii str. Silveira]